LFILDRNFWTRNTRKSNFSERLASRSRAPGLGKMSQNGQKPTPLMMSLWKT